MSGETNQTKLFLSYGRRDAQELADRLRFDLEAHGYEVWQDTRHIRPGTEWHQEIVDGLRSTQVVVALLSPHAVRVSADLNNTDNTDSVCLDEISFARFAQPPKPIVPVMAIPCEPPLFIFHLDYVNLCAWRDSEEQYREGLSRLVDGIEATKRGEKRFRSWYHDLDPWDFASFLNEKRRDFCGRQWLFDEIDAWRAASGNERALLITGDPGTGKSAIGAQLVHLNPGGQVLAFHCCQADTPATLEPWRFVRSLAAMIASKLDRYALQLETPALREILSETSCRTDPATAFERGILAPLESLPAPEGGPRYLLIDALDEAVLLASSASGAFTIVNLLATRLDRLAGWLRLVATTRKDPQVLEQLAGLRAKELDAQDPRNLDDVHQYIRHRLQSPALGEQVTASRLSIDAITRTLRQKSEGNFLYVQQALEGVERDTYGLQDLDALPPGLHGLYRAFFARHFPDAAAFAPARRVLEIVVAAEEPLSEQQLADIAELDIEDELPPILQQLTVYLRKRTDAEGNELYAVFHKSLADWLTDRHRRAHVHYTSLRRGHAALANHCWRQYQQGVGSMPVYAVRHLPSHLHATARWRELEQLLTDLAFLEAKTEAGTVFELAADYAATVRDMPPNHAQRRILTLLEEAIRRDIHFLSRHPTTLFQCLWNSCWWYDCPQAAKHYQSPDGPWNQTNEKLYQLLEAWLARREKETPRPCWLRSLRPPPFHLGSAQLAVFRGHESDVDSVGYSPDGRRIVSGSGDKTVRLWDAASGAQLAVLHGHEARVTSAGFSPEGRCIVSGSDDKTVRIWDADGGAQLAVLRGHEGGVTSVGFSSDGRRIVSGSRDKTLRVWDAANGTQLVELRGHENWVTSACYLPGGRRIVSGSWDKTVRVWDADGGPAAVLCGHEDAVTSVSCSPDGLRIVSGSYDKTVRVWDAANGTELVVLRGDEGAVSSVSYSPDGQRIVSGGYDKAFRVWDVGAGQLVRRLEGHQESVLTVRYSPDGRHLLSGSSDGTLRKWSADTGQQLRGIQGHHSLVRGVAYSRDGRRIASGSWDGTVRVWEAETGELLLCLTGHATWVNAVVFSPDGQRIISKSSDHTVRVWDSETGETRPYEKEYDGLVQGTVFSPDHCWYLGRSADSSLRIWSAKTREPVRCFHGHKGSIDSVAFSPDGRKIVSRSGDNTVRVWDFDSGQCLEVISGGGDVDAIAAAAPKSTYRALMRGLETVIENASSHQLVGWFPGPLNSLTTHPSGRTWAGCDANHVYILKLEGEQG